MPCLSAVETDPSIIVGGGDLAGIALRAFMVLWPLNCVLGDWDPVTCDWVLHCCNEHGTIYAISSDFDDRMTIQHLD